MEKVLILAFQLIVLLFSVVIHEVSHGAVANRLGDPTAKLLGRLTLNPVKHLDFFGSFLMPLFIFVASAGSFIFGWAKPVPYNPENLKNPKVGGGVIAAAGPLSNIFLAAAFAALTRLIGFAGLPVSPLLADFLGIVVLINLALAVFNFLPIPPLDGSKVLFAFLPDRFYAVKNFLERYGFFILIAFIFFGFSFIVPVIYWLYRLIS